MSTAALANAAWLASNLPSWNRFRRALHDPENTQREILRRLIAQNAECAFGRAHRFDTIRSYEEFRERVPIAEFESVEPWITRIRQGDRNVLTAEPVTRLIPTSGSTGGRKLVPFTAGFQRELNTAIGPWMVDLFRTYPAVAFGPAYWSISPGLPPTTEVSVVPIGFDDDSAYLGGMRQRLVDAALAAPATLRLVQNIDDSRYLTLLCLLRQGGLRMVSVWHPSFLTLLLDALPANWDELLRDVEHGSCRRADRLRVEVRRAVAANAKPRRAAELRRAGPENPVAFWPHLRVVSCWGDAQAALPSRALNHRLPGVGVQTKGLLATEALVSIPFRGLHPVAIRSHFYEFADPRGEVRLAHELRRGESYEIVVTTGGGLWRYRLGDLVEVNGMVDRTPSLRFLGRSGNVSDLCGEKLAETFVTRTLDRVFADRGLVPRFAMLAPEQDEDGSGYTLFVEGEVNESLDAQVDSALRANPHYAHCRDLGQLRPLRVLRLKGGAQEAFYATQAAEGRRLGDVKPQSLSSRSDWRTLFRAVVH